MPLHLGADGSTTSHYTGSLLCFASTSSGTVLHYVLDLQAPYGPFSLPKLLGVPGGIALCIGTLGLGYLKTKADPNLRRTAGLGGRDGLFSFVVWGQCNGPRPIWRDRIG